MGKAVKVLAAMLVVGLLAPGGAAADPLDAWCATVTTTRSIALCSDPALRQLALDRQQAFDAARARIAAAQRAALLADQQRWVAEYPVKCGLDVTRPAPLPLPAAVRDCMASAGRARILYLQDYKAAAADSGAPNAASLVAAAAADETQRGAAALAAPPVAPAAEPAAAPPVAAPVAAAQPAPAETGESAFVAVVEAARERYKAAANDMAKGGVRAARKAAICQVLAQPVVDDWVGTISQLSSNSDGSGVVEIAIGPDIYVETTNNSFSDSLLSLHTLVPAGSPLFAAFSHMAVGDKVRFSGSFLPSNVDCAEEASMSQEGSMTEPEFLMRFTAAAAAR